MTKSQPVTELVSAFNEAFVNNTFVSLSLGNYKGHEENLKNIYLKKILIKKEEKVSFTYRYKTRDIVKNYNIEEAKTHLLRFLNMSEFRVASLFTTGSDMSIEIITEDKIVLKTKAPTKSIASLSHDKAKTRLISSKNKNYLAELNITDNEGNVFKNAQDKYRQINHYVEILSSFIKELPTDQKLKVVDMGSGKGYLTFALYDYLVNVVNRDAEVTGVEFREDMVSLCNAIAKNSDFQHLNFEEGAIEKYDSSDANILIALHACDTATDDAIFKGITANADLIVVAPCCHKQIRRQIEKAKTQNDVDFLTRHGIFLERQAEMVTDGIRALILEYYGYKTKVFEFISDVHTPKNVMIVGVKNKKGTVDQTSILNKIKKAKTYFGIEYHHLEKMMGI